MNALILCGSFLVVILSAHVQAEPQDPRTRDEDISGSTLTVQYERRGDGLYEYIYSLNAPETNKGNVASIYLDLSCTQEFAPVPLPSPQDSVGYNGNSAEPGTISPSTILADYGAAALWGITPAGQAFWTRATFPGSETTGMRLVSPAAPGMRKYVLKPEWDTNPAKWDYTELTNDDMPKVEDFMVEGMIAGPGCPGVTVPVETPIYAGLKRREHLGSSLVR